LMQPRRLGYGFEVIRNCFEVTEGRVRRPSVDLANLLGNPTRKVVMRGVLFFTYTPERGDCAIARAAVQILI